MLCPTCQNEARKFGRDRDGNQRTAYSLRHTYICLRLMEGADIYQIAKNCRTSVEMIEKYYASHLKNTLDAAAINVRKSKVRTTGVTMSRLFLQLPFSFGRWSCRRYTKRVEAGVAEG